MHKKSAISFGVIFLLVGIMGFVPAVTPNGHLLGIFHVNAAHNIVHLLTGFAALMAGFASARASQLFFKVFGIIYAGVALLGFVNADQPILGVLANNIADAWLHVAIAAVSLVLGFVVRTESSVTDAQTL
jgi:hypothetical protein